MRQLFYYKLRQSSSQNASCFLLENVAILLVCDSFYKMRRFCYKTQQLLQIATFITKCVGVFFTGLFSQAEIFV